MIDELAAEADSGARAAASGVTRVWLDRQVTLTGAPTPAPAPAPAEVATPTRAPAPAQPALDGNLTQIGADAAWAAGLTGEGATVAVLDTGVDATHPDLAGRVLAQANFSDSPDVVDGHGHGTHVAAMAAGSGAGAGGARSGVAPNARLVVGKVVDDGGYGLMSQAIAGMEWAAPQADVVNMSLGYGRGSDGGDPLSLSLDALAAQHGTLFVVAAGNSGPGSTSVDFPGVADMALTVGAVDGQDEVAEFSSRGPVASSFELKPEVVAPGVDIVSARAAGTAMGEPVDDLYTVASGTSMASPHVAGAAALLVQAHPDWDVDELKHTLIASATSLDEDAYDAGSGRLDIGTGATATVRPGRDAVEAVLPSPRSAPHTEALSWTNDGPAPVTLHLAAELEDRGGTPVDEVSVEPEAVTVAPGATAEAALTVDGPDLDPGLYTGAVTATADGVPDARTPIAVHAAAETVELTVASTPPGAGLGEPVTFLSVVNLDDFGVFDLYTGFAGPSLTVTVPAGRYAVTGDVSTGDPDETIVAQVGDPDITLTEDATVVFDGPAAVPLHPTVEGVETAPPTAASAALLSTPGAGTGGYPIVTEVYSWYPAAPPYVTPMEADAELFAATQTYRLPAPYLTAQAGGSPVAVAGIDNAPLPEEGEHVYPAVDAGTGADLSAARDHLAIVDLPADRAERAAVSRRAAEAGVALLVFVDERRTHLSVDAWGFFDPALQWGDVPAIAAAGDAAVDLRAAATGGDDVTVTVAASDVVYDIVSPRTNRVEPAPVIDRAAQDDLATIDERFHRDPDGTGATDDRRYSAQNLMNLDSVGWLPERRTSYVTPDVPWQSMAIGPNAHVDYWTGERTVSPVALSLGPLRSYDPGSDHEVGWLSRPIWPGPVGDVPRGLSYCQPTPVARTADRLDVWISPFQDRLDGYGCGSVLDGTLALERDGVPVPEVEEPFPIAEAGAFPVPAGAADYRLTFEHEGQGPYPHRSSTVWTFRSAAPEGDGAAPVPLLVVGYDLPVDTGNQVTGDTATLRVRQVTGAPESRIGRVRAWTSRDGGTTWRRATVRHTRGSGYRLHLPDVDDGTAVSLRVEASDAAGSTINQTLYDAYTG